MFVGKVDGMILHGNQRSCMATIVLPIKMTILMDMGDTQLVSSVLINYLQSMGVDPAGVCSREYSPS